MVPDAGGLMSSAEADPFGEPAPPRGPARWRRVAMTYGVAAAIVAIVTLLRILLTPVVGDRPLAILFLFAVLGSAAIGGWGAGFFATAASVLIIDLAYVDPGLLHFDSVSEAIQLLLFLVVGCAASALVEALRRARTGLASHARTIAQNERKYHSVFNTTSDGIALVDDDGRFVDVNDAFCRLVKRSATELIGSDFALVVPPESIDEAWAGFERLKTQTVMGNEFQLIDAEGNAVELEWRSHANVLPGLHLCVAHDISERKRSEAALMESNERLLLALAASETGTWRIDLTSNSVTRDANLELMFGREDAAMIEPLEAHLDRLHPDDRAAVARAIDVAMETDGHYNAEFRVIRPDGTIKWFRDRGRVRFDKDRAPVTMTGAATDVTEWKEAKRHQELLLAELSHRVKNTLATVISIASQTGRQCENPQEFVEAFSGRLRSLARAHNILSASDWRRTELKEVVRSVLDPYRSTDGENRVDIGGDSIRIRPKQTLALNLALHELATNAVKYGALSTPEGQVHVQWRLERPNGHPEVKLSWVESGGPTVRKPERTGFGVRMIERGVSFELRGRASIEYDPAGLRCQIVFPLDAGDAILSGDAPGNETG